MGTAFPRFKPLQGCPFLRKEEHRIPRLPALDPTVLESERATLDFPPGKNETHPIVKSPMLGPSLLCLLSAAVKSESWSAFQ